MMKTPSGWVGTNIVRCKGATGIYKGKSIEIHIGAEGKDSVLLVDGKAPKEAILSITIHIKPRQLTTVNIEATKI